MNRGSAAALVLILHGAVFALILYSRADLPNGAKSGLAAFDIPIADAHEPRMAPHPARPRAATPATATPPPLLEPVRVEVLPSLPDALPITDALAQELPAAIGGGCDLTRQVQDALRHSDAVGRAMPAIPAAGRSIANAIVVWNAGWIDPGPGPAQTALAAIRQTIEQSVAASSADCRGQLQAGPRLIYLPDNAGKTTVLALGSGQWSWQQLSTPALPQSVDTALVAPAAASPARAQSVGAPGRTPALNALLASLIGKRLHAGTPYHP